MPNHVHLVVWLHLPNPVGATLAVAPMAVAPEPTDMAMGAAGASPAPTNTDPTKTWVIPKPETVNRHPTLGDVIGAFKSLVFTVYLDWVQANDPSRRAKFWQRNYYEHIVRNPGELRAIRRYIQNNPLKWRMDMDNPANFPKRPPPDTVDDYLRDAGVIP
jgi:hypothetical protein